MFIQNFFLVFGCLFLSAGFVLWTTDDFVESKMIGAKHAKKNDINWRNKFNYNGTAVKVLIYYT